MNEHEKLRRQAALYLLNYAYLLSQRKLDREVINAFARKGMIYESQD